MMWILRFFVALVCLDRCVLTTIHYLNFVEDTRRNIALTDFGYDDGGLLDFIISNLTVPEAVLNYKGSEDAQKTDKFGLIGFTLSRDYAVTKDVRANPHVCQLQNTDQQLDALFFVFDFQQQKLLVTKSGQLRSMKLCTDITSCPIEVPLDANGTLPTEAPGFFKRVFGIGSSGTAYMDYIPLVNDNARYTFHFAVRFLDVYKGQYQIFYHNCFNHMSNDGYKDLIAVDLTVHITEMNVDSYLSAGDSAKPIVFLYSSFFFALVSIVWIHKLCHSDPKVVYRIHRLMGFLVVLKTLSVFFHGVNYYFAARYGRQQEFWAVVFYITHLLKGAILFGTIILIGSGYTLFKNFLSDRDRNLFMFVLPLQIIDNIVMAIIDESEVGDRRYLFYVKIFSLLDLLCCVLIIMPVVWSIRHLSEGAGTDGKAAFNLEKLRLFRQFYMVVISYIYLTRIAKFMFDETLPFNRKWLSVAIVEGCTLFFFVTVGYMFRPVRMNPYLRLSSNDRDDDDPICEDAVALTTNGLYENVSRVQRFTVLDETLDIPGTINGGYESDDNDDDGDEKTAFIGKGARDITAL